MAEIIKSKTLGEYFASFPLGTSNQAVGTDLTAVAGLLNEETLEAVVDASISANVTGQYVGDLNYTPSLPLAAPVTLGKIFERFVMPEWFGPLSSDGETDDHATLAKAVATGKDLYLGYRTYASDAPLELFNVGQQLYGQGGIVNDNKGSRILFTNPSGRGIHVGARSTGIRRLRVDSSTTRKAAANNDAFSIFIGSDIVSAGDYPFYSRIELDGVYITDGPSDGLHVVGQTEFGSFKNVTVADCLRHGFVHDGGTISGRINKVAPAFEVNYERCRAFECGGNAAVMRSESAFSVTGLTLDHFEALGCGWDLSKRLSEYQVLLTGAQIRVIQPDIEDQQFANAISDRGRIKVARAMPSSGIQGSGQGHTYEYPYFSSLVQSMNMLTLDGLEITSPRIFAGAYTPLQSPAIAVANNVANFTYKGKNGTTGATQVLRSQSDNADIFLENKHYRGLTTSVADWEIVTQTPPTVVIASGVANVTSSKVLLAGEGAAADTLSTFRLASGVNGYVGLECTIMYAGQDISITAGATIAIIGGGALSLTAANPIIRAIYNGSVWQMR